MDYKDWKRFKRSGNYRRKVLKRCNENSLASTISFKNSDINKARTYESSEGSVGASIFLEPNKPESDTFSSEGSYSDDEGADKLQEFSEQLKVWAIEYNISHQALKKLLQIIDKPLPNILPKDPRTI